MPLKQPLTVANDAPDKTENIACDCSLLWSLAHQFTYLRLSDKIGENEYKLIDLFEARAKRIAATYARFYLETEEGGDPSKKGRHYWMALGAFASKTVACLLASFQLNASYALKMSTVANGLGQGNFWLFTDVAAAHWLYNNYPDHFSKGMSCSPKRNSNDLEEHVAEITKKLPWSQESLTKINNLQPSEHILAAFKNTQECENIFDKIIKRDKQLEHLLNVANHEQGPILQKLIYDDPKFSWWAKLEREWVPSWMSPDYKLVFANTCGIQETDLQSNAPDDLIIESFASRMGWIQKAASKFHKLMDTKSNHMEKELHTIASWVNEPDARLVYQW